MIMKRDNTIALQHNSDSDHCGIHAEIAAIYKKHGATVAAWQVAKLTDQKEHDRHEQVMSMQKAHVSGRHSELGCHTGDFIGTAAIPSFRKCANFGQG